MDPKYYVLIKAHTIFLKYWNNSYETFILGFSSHPNKDFILKYKIPCNKKGKILMQNLVSLLMADVAWIQQPRTFSTAKKKRKRSFYEVNKRKKTYTLN